MKEAASTASSIIIEQPATSMIGLEVGGPCLIQNRFSQKALEQLLRKHMAITSQRERKIPSQVIKDATILNVDGVNAIPPQAFKAAMLTAATATGDKSLKKTQLRVDLYVVGRSIPFTYERSEPGMDPVRTSGINRTIDIRFRPYFYNWKARLIIQFEKTKLKVQTVVDLLNRAGTVGVGEWRPEKNGTFGTFRVLRVLDTEAELVEVYNACQPQLEPLIIPQWALDSEMDTEALTRIMNETGAALPHEGGTDN